MSHSNTVMFRWHCGSSFTFNLTLIFLILHTVFLITNICFPHAYRMWEKNYLSCSIVLSTSHSRSYCWGLGVTNGQPPSKCCFCFKESVRGFAVYMGFSQRSFTFPLLMLKHSISSDVPKRCSKKKKRSSIFGKSSYLGSHSKHCLLKALRSEIKGCI